MVLRPLPTAVYGLHGEGPLQYILCCIQVAIMNRPAPPAFPGALFKRQARVSVATLRARLGGREVAINLQDFLILLLSDVLKDRREAAESKVADLPAPKLFHGSDVEIFDADRVYRMKSHRASLK